MVLAASIALLFVAGANAKLCWPGMDQSTWPCSDVHDDPFFPVFAQQPPPDSERRYQNVRGACTPCSFEECDKNLRIEQDLQHCQWHVMPEFPRVYWQNTGNGEGCKMCIDGRCEAFYGTYISTDQCLKETQGRKVMFQKTRGECRPCFEGRCAMDIEQYDSVEACQNARSLAPSTGGLTVKVPLSKLCITCFVSPCPPGLHDACRKEYHPYQKSRWQFIYGGCHVCYGVKKEGKGSQIGICESVERRWEKKEECELANGITPKPKPAPLPPIQGYQKTGPNGACQSCRQGQCAQDIGLYETWYKCTTAPKETPFDA